MRVFLFLIVLACAVEPSRAEVRLLGPPIKDNSNKAKPKPIRLLGPPVRNNSAQSNTFQQFDQEVDNISNKALGGGRLSALQQQYGVILKQYALYDKAMGQYADLVNKVRNKGFTKKQMPAVAQQAQIYLDQANGASNLLAQYANQLNTNVTSIQREVAAPIGQAAAAQGNKMANATAAVKQERSQTMSTVGLSRATTNINGKIVQGNTNLLGSDGKMDVNNLKNEILGQRDIAGSISDDLGGYMEGGEY